MPVERRYVFICDDHAHEDPEDNNPGFPSIYARSAESAKNVMRKQGWSFHYDGRAFCKTCTARQAQKTSGSNNE